MNKLLLTFYGDDFTGSTDALEQLARFGIRAMLFIKPPSPAQLKRFPGLQAVGVAGMTRSLTPAAMERELRPAFKRLKALGAPHVHYKVCSTFDSSPTLGSIGRALDVGTEIFRGPFVPMVVGAPALGRYCLFGNLFARLGIGSKGGIFRLDRHPSVSRHPVTPMREADLRLHLTRQTRKEIALFDILKVALPVSGARVVLKDLLKQKPDAILFDVLEPGQLERIGGLIDAYASAARPLFSVGSSGIEMALGAHWVKAGVPRQNLRPARRAGVAGQILAGSGSCSPVTRKQIAWALRHGFAEVALDPAALAAKKRSEAEIQRVIRAAVRLLKNRRNVIVHTTLRRPDRSTTAKLKDHAAPILGTALGRVLRGALEQVSVHRLCVAGGDTSSYAARALGIEALEVIRPLVPGSPLCRATAPGSPVDGMEVNFKGGQVGGDEYFGILKRGRI